MRTGVGVADGRGSEADDDAAGEPDRDAAADTERNVVIERVTSREAADRWHRISRECFEADYYEMPAPPVQEIYERLESTRADERYELWLGSVGAEAGGGTPVVLGEVGLPMLDNTDNAVVTVSTRPSFRRRGYGTAMLRHLTARARANDRTRVIGEIGEPMPLREIGEMQSHVIGDASPNPVPGVRFAAHAGARAVTTEVRRLLRIDELDHAELARLKEDATAHSTGYSLIQWEGPAPEEIVSDLAVLHSRMTIDAPLEDLDWEPEQWSPERYREREQRVVTSGQVGLSTVARHDQSGQIVALTEIGLEAAPPEIAYQWSTIVLPTHRGHRLGMLVKVANLEFLQSSRPLVQMLNTWNAAVNDHMVGINEAMGFRAIEQWSEWQLELSDSTN